MAVPPDVAPFATMLADLTHDLRRGSCCLVVCDKGWTLPLFVGLKQRLQAVNYKIGYLDGRVTNRDCDSNDSGVMLTTVAQMRWAVRTPEADGVAFALPHLDIMTAVEGGWTSVSREVIPLLYEKADSIWLGFQDPSVTLPPLVEKVFTRRYVLETPFRTRETIVSRAESKEEPVTVPGSEPVTGNQHPLPASENAPGGSEPKSPRPPASEMYSRVAAEEPPEPTGGPTSSPDGPE